MFRHAFLPLVLPLALAACAAEREPPPLSDDAPAPELTGCCALEAALSDAPAWIGPVLERIPEAVLGAIATTDFRDGYLARFPEARGRIHAAARPLDVVLMRFGSRIGGMATPGHFTHSAIYLGTEAELRAMGLWDTPALRPYHAAFADGPMMLEARGEIGGVRVQPSRFAGTDAVALYRAPRADAARLTQALSLAGRPFDTRYDVADAEAVFCVELIPLAHPEIALPPRPFFGRDTYLPDDIARLSLRHPRQLRLLGHIEAFPGGWRATGPTEIAERLAEAWAEG